MTGVPTISLGEIMASKSGSLDPSKYPDEVFELYSIPAFDGGKPELVEGRAIGSAKQIVKPGDVLLSRIVPHIRRSWVVENAKTNRIIASGEWIVFRSSRIYPKYLRHVLVGNPFHSQFMRTVSGVGGSLLRARPAHVAKIEIPLPALPEQRRIADVLDRAEALRAKRRAALTQLDTLDESIFLNLFGDPARNPFSFPVVSLGDLFCAPPCYGSMVPPSDHGHWTSLRVGNIQDWKLDLTDRKYIDLPRDSVGRYALKDGDVVLARAIASQEYLGKCIVVHPGEESWAFDSHLMRLRLDRNRIVPEYLVALLQTAGGRSIFLSVTRRSAVQFNVNTREINSMRLPLPPLDIQLAFAERTVEVEGIRSTQRRFLSTADNFFSALQQCAFEGGL